MLLAQNFVEFCVIWLLNVIIQYFTLKLSNAHPYLTECNFFQKLVYFLAEIKKIKTYSSRHLQYGGQHVFIFLNFCKKNMPLLKQIYTT